MGLRPCSVSVVAGPDTGSLAARIRASSAGEGSVSEIDGDLPGTRIFTSSIAEADVFVVAGGGGHLESEGDRMITKKVQTGQCPGIAVTDRYGPRQHSGAGPALPRSRSGVSCAGTATSRPFAAAMYCSASFPERSAFSRRVAGI